ncbi:Uncharacterised protein [Klebsiella pneumoniae]|uniref:Uncharacterized protein n=1 Tax=Klebsiella pneumoniae TaxID=573 RepID=A0A377V3R7_KLEPN|nr:Uncharacterised protein [Klebsiella pneumoniae]
MLDRVKTKTVAAGLLHYQRAQYLISSVTA